MQKQSLKAEMMRGIQYLKKITSGEFSLNEIIKFNRNYNLF
jgi:hypothetical protein